MIPLGVWSWSLTTMHVQLQPMWFQLRLYTIDQPLDFDISARIQHPLLPQALPRIRGNPINIDNIRNRISWSVKGEEHTSVVLHMYVHMYVEYSKQLEEYEHSSRPKIDYPNEHTEYGLAQRQKARYIDVCRQLIARRFQHIYMESVAEPRLSLWRVKI